MSPVKYIAHFDLDSFFVSVERLFNPELAKIGADGKMPPVVVGGSADRRGVVASASYEARAYGVRSAMPMKTALRLCPSLIVVKGRHHTYGEISSKIVKRFLDFVPEIEQTSIDEGYLDFTGCGKLFNNDFHSALKMLQSLVETEFSLPVSFGMGSTRVIAKIASGKAKPKGILVIEPGHEKSFLGGLDVDEIPGVGPKTGELLRNKGFNKVSRLQEVPEEKLKQMLGKYGVDLYLVIHGKSSAEVSPSHERKSISSEETFARDVAPDTDFGPLFLPHVEEICYRLRKENKKAKTVTVKIRYEDFTTITRAQSLPPVNDDGIVLKAALELFNQSRDRSRPVRLIGVGLSNLTDKDEPMDLFEPSGSKRESALQSMDSIRKKYGLDAVTFGRVSKNRGKKD